jgi:sterol desaturase/sphingolipid hydroxylase (fatty acid hydroxylase superfamily)
MEYKSLAIVSSIVIFGILETLVPFFQYRQNPIKRVIHNLILGLINFLVVNLTVILILNSLWKPTLWRGLFYDINLPWLHFILSFLLLDLYMYTWHRLIHNWGFAWRFHKVHHTDRWMNISTAYRFHTVEVVFANIPKFGLIYLLGITQNAWILYESLFAVSLVFHHSNFALPFKIDKFLSYIIVTPNYHRAHHCQLTKYLNSNYSSLLTIWDLIFQSRYYPPQPETIQFGLPEKTREFNVISLLKLPFMSV